MSRSSQSSRTESLIRGGNAAMQAMLKEPVKEAVREALAEERMREYGQSDGASGSSEKSTGGRRFGPGMWLLVLASAAGAIYYTTRLRGQGGGDGGMTGSGRTDFGEAEDMPTDDPLSGQDVSGDESTRESMNQ